VKEVRGDFVDIKAVSGLVEEIRWYRKGMPRVARRKGSSIERVDCALNTISKRSFFGNGHADILCLSTDSN